MAKPKLSALEHLRMLALRSRAYFTSNLAEMSETIADALTDMDNSKADTKYVDDAVAAAKLFGSATEGSSKQYRITIEDGTGRIVVTEV